MHLLQVFSLLFSFVMISSVFPKALGVHVAQSTTSSVIRFNIIDFQISNMTLLTAVLPDTLTSTHTLSFNFTDPNSNGTNTICNSTWTSQPNGTNTAPMSYIRCQPTNITTEFFLWEFSSITNLTNFNLRLAHEFLDPAHYPPPFSAIEYFSDVPVTLTCHDAAGTRCDSPALNATIDSEAN